MNPFFLGKKMARIRTIKPEFFRHEGLQELETKNPGSYAMLVFSALWGHCDNKGRFQWRPRQLKLDILPFLNFSMEETLSILAESGMVNHYSVDGKEYGEIASFNNHQRITGKEATDGEKYPGNTGESIVKHQGNNGERQEFQEGKGKEKEKERIQKPVRAKSAQPFPEGFELNQTGIDYANERFVDVKSSFDDFRNYHQAKGTKMSDWNAAWRTWCNKAVEYGKTKSPQPQETNQQRLTRMLAAAL